ncbi:DUF3052 domain-containing protein [Ramlibacter sp. PS4R-6]|uniref:DUF3052 domain-containing protein n=1 Tax=Ramlibacter sp. PS4R-6 TaxID=3133438 RepID=UPI0030A40EC0
MAGYSGTPLAKKLGIKESSRVALLHAPSGYARLLEPLPEGVTITDEADAQADIVQVFAMQRSMLAKYLPALRKALAPDAAVWVSWPKKASKVPTDITEDTVREVALPLGFVDIKVCAVDDTWSGLKLVVRKELRAPATVPS